MKLRFLLVFMLSAFCTVSQAQFISPPVFYRGEEVDTLSYEEHLAKAMSFRTPWMGLTYHDVDTALRQLTLDTWFELPRSLTAAMVRDFRSDTSLLPVAVPLKAGNKQAMFQFGKMTLKWRQINKAFISEGPLPLLAIGKEKINKQVKGHVMIETKLSGNVLTIYLENGKGGWYIFTYANGIMLAYTPDEKLKTKISKQSISRGKGDDPKYKCVLGSPNERSLLFKKMKRAGVQ